MKPEVERTQQSLFSGHAPRPLPKPCLFSPSACVADLRQELAVQQKQQVQDRKPSFSGAVREPTHPSTLTPPSLPTPPITPQDRRVEDKMPPRVEASVESSPALQPPTSRGQYLVGFRILSVTKTFDTGLVFFLQVRVSRRLHSLCRPEFQL